MSMRHEVTDGEMMGKKKEMNRIDNMHSLGAHHHLQRRQCYREFVREHHEKFKKLGETARVELLKVCDPEKPHPDRVTKFIAKVAPKMKSIGKCCSSSECDEKTKEFGYNCNHPLRAVIFAHSAKVGIEAAEIFDKTRDDYVMKKEVGEKYEVVDQALETYNYSLKDYFKHIKVGKWQGGCIICRLVNVKEVQKRVAGDALDGVMFKQGLEALKILCPELFARVSLEDANQKKGIRRDKKGKIGDVLLCRITQTLLEYWDTPYDNEFPKFGVAVEGRTGDLGISAGRAGDIRGERSSGRVVRERDGARPV